MENSPSSFPQRLSRGNYAIAVLSFLVLFIVLMGIFGVIDINFLKINLRSTTPSIQNVIGMIIFMAPMLLFYSLFLWLSVRRMNDTGRSGLLCISLLIPVLQVLTFLYLLFWKGDQGTNEYGHVPEQKIQNPFSTLDLNKLNRKEWQNLIIILVIMLALSGYIAYEGSKYWEQKGANSTATTNQSSKENQTTLTDSGWTELTSTYGGYKLQFPQKPTTTQSNDVQQEINLADMGNTAFLSTSIFIKDSLKKTDNETLFKKNLDTMSQAMGSKILSSNKTKMLNLDAEDFKLENTEKGIITDGKVFRKDDIFYILMYGHTKDTYVQKDYETFINSFEFLKP